MEEGLVAFLLVDPALGALVSNRIDWTTRPQATAMPSIVLTRIGGLQDYSMAGPTGLVTSRVQVDCWGKTQASAVAVARGVTASLGGARGILGGVILQGAFLDGERHSFEQGSGGDKFFRVSLDFILHHTET